MRRQDSEAYVAAVDWTSVRAVRNGSRHQLAYAFSIINLEEWNSLIEKKFFAANKKVKVSLYRL